MRRTQPNPINTTLGEDFCPTFNVVIAYEDLESGKHAKRTYDYLVQQLGRENKLTNQMWNFEILNMPHLRQVAVQDALAADIIIVACQGANDLPPSVRRWIDAWSAEKPQAMVLVALFDPAYGDGHVAQETRSYLSKVASRSGMGFFSQPGEPNGFDRARTPEAVPLSDLGAPDHEFGRAVTPGVASWPRWGINE